jgi:drug/metabolite transporter superfamily protein YnfA
MVAWAGCAESSDSRGEGRAFWWSVFWCVVLALGMLLLLLQLVHMQQSVWCAHINMYVSFLLHLLQVWDKDMVTDDDVIGRSTWSFCPKEVRGNYDRGPLGLLLCKSSCPYMSRSAVAAHCGCCSKVIS